MAKFRVFLCKAPYFGIAAALDLGVYRAILVHPTFYELPSAWRAAILAHEEGHLVLKHVRERWKWFLTGMQWRDPVALRVLLANQEFEADAYCAQRGYAAPMIAFLLRLNRHARKVRPPLIERIHRLRAHEFRRRIPPRW